MEYVRVNTDRAYEMYDRLPEGDKMALTRRIAKRREFIKKSPNLIKKRTFKHHPQDDYEYMFYHFDTFRHQKDAAMVVGILRQKDHMARVMLNRSKYEIWTRII